MYVATIIDKTRWDTIGFSTLLAFKLSNKIISAPSPKPMLLLSWETIHRYISEPTTLVFEGGWKWLALYVIRRFVSFVSTVLSMILASYQQYRPQIWLSTSSEGTGKT